MYTKVKYTHLANQVRGLYCKLRSKFFHVDVWPKSMWAINQWEKKLGFVTYNTDREKHMAC